VNELEKYKNQEMITYCRSVRSFDLLNQHRFYLVNLEGGMHTWKNEVKIVSIN
jgi:hypothetical protein